MLQKFVQDTFRQGKRTIGQMYHHATQFSRQVDHGMRVGKRLFAALHPLINDLGGGRASRAIVDSFGAFERGRDQVIGMDNKVQAQLSRLRTAVPELGLD